MPSRAHFSPLTDAGISAALWGRSRTWPIEGRRCSRVRASPGCGWPWPPTPRPPTLAPLSPPLTIRDRRSAAVDLQDRQAPRPAPAITARSAIRPARRTSEDPTRRCWGAATISYWGLRITASRRSDVTVPRTSRRVPRSMPGTAVRPWKTSVTDPELSLSTQRSSCRPPSWLTVIDRMRPAMSAFWRSSSAPMGSAPPDRAASWTSAARCASSRTPPRTTSSLSGTSRSLSATTRERPMRYGMIVAARARHVHHRRRDGVGGAVVQEALEARVESAPRQDHHAEDVGVAHDVGHELQGRAVDAAVLALGDLEVDPEGRGVGRPPARLEALGDHRVDVEVDRADRIGVERLAVRQGALGRQVVVVDEDDDPIGADV